MYSKSFTVIAIRTTIITLIHKFCKNIEQYFVRKPSISPYSFNPFPNKPWFLRVCNSSRFLKTLWEKKKFLVKSNFSFSHSVFCPFGKFSAIFVKFEIVVCKLSVWKSLKYVVWEGLKIYLRNIDGILTTVCLSVLATFANPSYKHFLLETTIILNILNYMGKY